MLSTALGYYAVFTLINLLFINKLSYLPLVLTVLAVAELLVYLGLVAPPEPSR